MKRKFLASILTIAMLATMLSAINVMAEDIVGETYFDINMDDWSNYNTNKNTDGTDVESPWTWNDTVTLDTDVAKGNNSWKLTMPAGERFSDKHYSYVRTGTLDATKYFDSNCVYWTEVSLKFDGQFTAVGWEHNSAIAPLMVDADGNLRQCVRSGYNIGEEGQTSTLGKELDYHLELGKWYHFVVALDIRNETSSGAPTYVWVNGEAIDNTYTDVAFSSAKLVKYIQLWFDKPETGSSTIWVDNYKFYTTTDLDNHAASDFNINVADADESDSITLYKNSVIVPSDATVESVKATITTDNTANTVFVKDGVSLADTDLAVGSVMIVNSSNGIGFKQYDITDNPPEEEIIPDRAETYFDMNMDNWTSVGTNTNIDGTTVKNNRTWNTIALDTDAAKGNNSWKLTMPDDKFPDKHYSYVRTEQENLEDKTFDSQYVYWTEVSLKFEGQFTSVGWEHNSAVAPLVVDANGHLRQFVKQGYNDANSLMAGKDLNYHLELGKWYHIVVALDFRNDTGSGAPSYVWVNGEDISSNANKDTALKIGAKVRYIDLWFDKPATGSSTVWVDNYKFYTTTDLDNHAASNFNINVADADESDSITLYKNSVTVPSDATVGAVKAGVTINNKANTVFVKDGATLEDDDLAVFSVMTVNSSNGIGFKQYDVIDHLPAQDIIPEHVKSITTSLPEMNGYHPAIKMIDDSIAGDNLYKASKKYDDQPFKIQITLDGVYKIEKLSIYERFVIDYGTSVSAYLGKNGVFTQVADNVDLRAHLPSGISFGTITLTSINIADTIEDKEADTIILIFTGERPETETNYQIYEIEALGYKTADVATTGFVSAYSYRSATNDVVVSLMNASDEPVEGEIFIAAYEGNKFVAITNSQPVKFEKGVSQYTIPASGIKDDGRTYKAFILDKIDGLKPLVGVAIISQ